jgi:hypothetical protein
LIYAGHYYVNIVYPSTKYPTGGDNYIDIITDTTQNMTTDVPAKTIVRADIGVSSRGVAATLAVTVFAADDATPSVCIGNFFKTANVNPTTITTLDGGYAGKKVVVLIGDAQTTVDFTGTALKGNGGADWSPGSIYDWMECVYDGTYWHCAVHESS